MEPRQQGLIGGHEQESATAGNYDNALHPDVLSSTPEKAGEMARPEVGAVQAEAAHVAMPALPTPVVAAPAPVAQSSDDSLLPDVASDDDLIEKEWVDKAKKILAETRDDPYRREREVSKLQIEYIRRRYGREIGDTGE